MSSRARVAAAALVATTAALLSPIPGSAAPTAHSAPHGPDVVEVTGTVQVLPGERGEDDRHSLLLPSGRSIALPADFEAEPLSRFAGTLAVPGSGTGSTLTGSARTTVLRRAAATGQSLRVVDSRVAPAAPAPGPTSHTTYIAKVTNLGALQLTDAQLLAGLAQAQQWWVQQSGGLIGGWTTASAVVPVTTAAGSVAGGCGLGNGGAQFSPIAQEIGAQAFPGVDFSGRSPNHLVVVVPHSTCQNGQAAARGNLGTSLANGGPVIIQDAPGQAFRYILEHEYGHNVGLQHADNAHAEYGNLYEVMGSGPAQAPNPTLGTGYRLEQGILAPGEAVDGVAGGTWTVASRAASTGLRGVHFINPDDGLRHFVDLRDGAGGDAGSCYAAAAGACNFTSTIYKQDYRPGLVVSREKGRSGSFLLAAPGNDGALQAGETWTNTGGSLSVTADAANRVRITRTPKPALGAGTASATAPVANREAVASASIPGATAVRYQWVLNGQAVPHAEEATFSVTPAMAGGTLSVIATGYAVGRNPSPPAQSAAQVIAPAAWYGGGARRYPEISGTLRVGQVLTAAGIDWVDAYGQRPADFSTTYQWMRGGKVIPGATTSTYRLAPADLGKTIQVSEYPRAAGHVTTQFARSYATSRIGVGRLVTTRPRIKGKARVGKVVKAVTRGWTTGTKFDYTWFVGKRAIKGATKRKLRITRSMRGKKISVRVVGKRSGYRKTALKSRPAKVR